MLIYLSFYKTVEDWLEKSNIPFDDPAGAKAGLIDLGTGWDARITALIAACDDAIPGRSPHSPSA